VDCLGESDGVVLSVKHGVVKLHEDVAQDEHVLVVMGRDGERHYSDLALFSGSEVLNPMVRGHVVVSTINGEREGRRLKFATRFASPGSREIFVFLRC